MSRVSVLKVGLIISFIFKLTKLSCVIYALYVTRFPRFLPL